MGVGYFLVNHTKREQVVFAHIPANTKRELAGHPASSAITTWYLLDNLGDRVAFVSDTHSDWPFEEGSRTDLGEYREVTLEVVQTLIERGILVEEGREHYGLGDADTFDRQLRNVWHEEGNS